MVQRIHGLIIACADLLPGIAACPGESPDLKLSIVQALPAVDNDAMELYRSPPSVDSDDANVLVAVGVNGGTAFRYSDGTQLDVNTAAEPVEIAAVIAPSQTLEDLAAYLYGPVLGFVLRALGTLALHASCVRIGDGAVLFVGAGGAGKSTLAAAFVRRGNVVCSDDLTAITPVGGRYQAQPAFDHVRLWDSGETLVFGGAQALERITPTWNKRRLSLAQGQFATAPLFVRAIYVLGDGEMPDSRQRTQALPPVAAILTLATHTYANYLLTAAQRAEELLQLGALVRSVPVRHLVNYGVPLNELCDWIERDLAMTASPADAGS